MSPPYYGVTTCVTTPPRCSCATVPLYPALRSATPQHSLLHCVTVPSFLATDCGVSGRLAARSLGRSLSKVSRAGRCLDAPLGAGSRPASPRLGHKRLLVAPRLPTASVSPASPGPVRHCRERRDNEQKPRKSFLVVDFLEERRSRGEVFTYLRHRHCLGEIEKRGCLPEKLSLVSSPP